MVTLAVEIFLAGPSAEALKDLRKTDLVAVARHYNLATRQHALKAEYVETSRPDGYEIHFELVCLGQVRMLQGPYGSLGDRDKPLIRLPFTDFAVGTALLALTGLIACIIISLMFHFDESTYTHCQIVLGDSKPVVLQRCQCTCVAGTALCSHVAALLYQTAHYSQLRLTSVPPSVQLHRN
ncbi:hypothetical protein UPYG_G00112050 [Umbra pygmaea]|uniref:SWIM-type domain-containing protein n=1 Tax=Umbra pygmaea TaxID=75934 RepID=A0ABD0XNF7_UMBPY